MRWTTVFWLMLGLVTWLMLIELPPKQGGWPYWDKVQHIVVFGVLTSLACLAYANFWMRMCCILVAYGALIEGLQSLLTVTRQASLGDWLADIIGVMLVIICFVVFRKAKGLNT